MGKASSTTVEPATVSTKYEQHPLALQLTPGIMPDEEFQAFCSDLKRRGQQHPIVLYEGKVLDGMHRYRGCLQEGLTPLYKEYNGDDAAGLVIALNVLRRKLGSNQRALAGARLSLDFGISQGEAEKRVGVSKLHINLVCQAIKSKNARVIKLLENPNLTRQELYEELVDCGIVQGSSKPVPVKDVAPPVPGAAAVSAAGALVGLDALYGRGSPENDDEDLLGGDDDGGIELDDDLLGDAPSAGGKVLNNGGKQLSEGGMPVVGSKPSHPERRAKDTPASLLAEKFRAFTEPEKLSFMQLTWHVMRPLIKAAGLSAEAPTAAETKSAPKAPSKVAKAAAAKVAEVIGAAKASAKAAAADTDEEAPAPAVAKAKRATTAKAKAKPAASKTKKATT